VSYFGELAQKLQVYLNDKQIELIHQAFLVAEEAHKGQMRRSGEPYITHPVAAAMILADMRMDGQSIMATLLHDVLEDTAVTKEELVAQFGDSVAELVDGVSKLTQIKFESKAEAQAENFRKMMMAMVRDIRVIIVKLADRLHNMRTLGVMPAKKKRRIAIETLEIYSPIANRLGMRDLYTELEDLGFKALYPMRYKAISDAVLRGRGNRGELMKKVEQSLVNALVKSNISDTALVGRQKHLYSIYKKMRNKKASFGEIMDVFAFRVLAKDIDACYRVLGAVHQAYKPVPARFKDYIAIPKANGYQSLHTTLFGPFGVPLEIQIRTEEMDRIATNGVAAHWIYKSSGLEEDEAQLRARAWIKNLMEMQSNAGDSLEFIENVKIDLFPDEVYVFTPKGDIVEIQRGATSVDFAYRVHSDVGNSCVAAKIDRRLAPLSTPLLNGQTVEIITAPGARPNPAWLNFVITGKARANIRNFLKSQQEKESVAFGKRLLGTALAELSSSLETIPQDTMKGLLRDLNYKNTKMLYENIGFGNQIALVIAQRLLNHQEISPEDMENVYPNKVVPLAIKGTEGMMVHYALCCHPIPGDPIIGQLVSGKGVKIHVDSCPHVNEFRHKYNEFINLCWDEQVTGEFLVEIVVEVSNKRGVLGILASAIAGAEANIDDVQVEPSDGSHSTLTFKMTLHDRIHLARVMRRLRADKSVLRLYRKKMG
jgi:guanosine-3',5'-bis(diphosphate) 3'-pyrophosphohydrolase